MKNRLNGSERNGEAVPKEVNQNPAPADDLDSFFDTGEPNPDPKPEDPATALNKRFDRLNALWQMGEARLKMVPLPVDASVVMHTHYADEWLQEIKSEQRLGFVKSKGGWKICIGVVDYQPDGASWTPVGECTYEQRLAAVAFFSKLQQAVYVAANEEKNKLDDAIRVMEEALGLDI